MKRRAQIEAVLVPRLAQSTTVIIVVGVLMHVSDVVKDVMSIAFLPLLCNFLIFLWDSTTCVLAETERFYHVKHMDQILYDPEQLLTDAIYDPIRCRRSKKVFES